MSKAANKLKYILEIIWLLVGLFAVGIAIYETFTNGFQGALPFYAATFAAAYFYFTRRNQRIKNTQL